MARVAFRTPDAAPPRAECKSVRAKTVHNSWTAVDLAADRVAWARLLRRAHEVVLGGRGTPPVLRPVIVGSWERCVAAGVDVDRPARGSSTRPRRRAVSPPTRWLRS